MNITPIKIITTVWVLLIVVPTVIFLANYEPDETFHVEVFKVGEGFGYDIISGEQIIIKQENIPAIRQKKKFISYDQAEKVAYVVVDKLKKGLNPAISLEELKLLGILVELE